MAWEGLTFSMSSLNSLTDLLSSLFRSDHSKTSFRRECWNSLTGFEEFSFPRLAFNPWWISSFPNWDASSCTPPRKSLLRESDAKSPFPSRNAISQSRPRVKGLQTVQRAISQASAFQSCDWRLVLRHEVLSGLAYSLGSYSLGSGRRFNDRSLHITRFAFFTLPHRASMKRRTPPWHHVCSKKSYLL